MKGKVNTLAIISFICSIFLFILSIIGNYTRFSTNFFTNTPFYFLLLVFLFFIGVFVLIANIISLNQIKKNNQEGKTLIIIGFILLGLSVLVLVGFIIYNVSKYIMY